MLHLLRVTRFAFPAAIAASVAGAQEPDQRSGRPVTYASEPVDQQEPAPPPPQQPAAQPPAQPSTQPQVVYTTAPPPTYATATTYTYPAQDTAPSRLPYRDGPVPEGYYVEESTRPGMWIPGIAVFSGAYVLSVLAARPSENNGTAGLYVPFIGPWITIAECTDCEDGVYSLLALDGLAQVGGATLFILGLTLTRKEFVREYQEQYSVLPRRFGRDGYGLSFQGTF